MDSRLDALLELTREPFPADEPFVANVMAGVRSKRQRVWRKQRALARPLALAAAAAIIVGGGVAALVRSTAVMPDAALELAPPAHTGAPTAPGGQPIVPPSVSVPPAGDAERAQTFRRGDLEWGYVSGTSAYAVDHETGLRLDTQIYRTEVDTDVPQRVTLKLSNTGDQPIAVTAPGGCSLMVGAYSADSDREEQPWRCATSPEDARAPAADRFVLEPGGQRVADATIVLTDGDWGLVGMCRCSYETAEPSTPEPEGGPLDDLPELGSSLPVYPTPQRPAEDGPSSLVTPPIRVKAS